MNFLTSNDIIYILRELYLQTDLQEFDNEIIMNLLATPRDIFKNVYNLNEDQISRISRENKKYLDLPRIISNISAEEIDIDWLTSKIEFDENDENVINLEKPIWIEGFSNETYIEFDNYPKCKYCDYESGTMIKKERIKEIFGDIISNDKDLIFGKGLGSHLMKKFIQKMKKSRYTSIILEPIPIGKYYSNKLDDLIRYYKTLGFKKYKGYMYMNL